MLYLADKTPVRMSDVGVRCLSDMTVHSRYTPLKPAQDFLKGNLRRFKYRIWSWALRHAGPRRRETGRFFISIYFTSGSHNVKVSYDWMVVGTCQPACDRLLSVMKTLTSFIVYVVILPRVLFLLRRRTRNSAQFMRCLL